MRSNALDFDDLLLKTYELFVKHPEIADYYSNKFQYIHIDEFQDTNSVQFEIAKILSAHHGNLFVVGDDDQSIYGWRGADIRNILDFERDYKQCSVIKLEKNYRSTATILMSGFFSLRYLPTPVIVPPVPTPATKISTLPSVSFQISGPVVR